MKQKEKINAITLKESIDMIDEKTSHREVMLLQVQMDEKLRLIELGMNRYLN